MPTSLNINDIFSQVRQLDKEDQMNLLQRLVLLVRKTHASKGEQASLTSLPGLGRDVWKDIDAINKHIDEERQW